MGLHLFRDYDDGIRTRGNHSGDLLTDLALRSVTSVFIPHDTEQITASKSHHQRDSLGQGEQPALAELSVY